MRIEGVIDLDAVAAAGERVTQARDLLDAMVAGGRDALREGPVMAYLIVAEGNGGLDAKALGDVLALAVLRLAEVGRG